MLFIGDVTSRYSVHAYVWMALKIDNDFIPVGAWVNVSILYVLTN